MVLLLPAAVDRRRLHIVIMQCYAEVGHGGKDFGPWIVGGSIAALAFALCMIAYLISSVHDDVYKEIATNSANAEAKRQFEQECALKPTIKEVVSCFGDAVEHARKTARDEEDVDAQKQMAGAAWAMLFATLLIGFLSLALTVIGVIFVRQTLYETRRTANAAVETNKNAIEANRISRLMYVADQRPWIKVKCTINGPIKWNENGCNIQVRFFLENIGKTPAIKTVIWAEVIALFNHGNPSKLQELFADRAKNTAKINNSGFVVFPNDPPQEQVHNLLIKNEEIERVKAHFEQVFGGRPGMEVIVPIVPMVYGCVCYQFTLSDDVFDTGFIYIVGRKTNEIITRDIGDIPAEQLCLENWFVHGRAT